MYSMLIILYAHSVVYFDFTFFLSLLLHYFFFFFNDTATTEIYTLSLHDALPISLNKVRLLICASVKPVSRRASGGNWLYRSEEHTSELQSRVDLVCRLLLEKKKKKKKDKKNI